MKPRLQGRAQLFHYVDDAVAAFSSEEDVRRVMGVLPKRFEKFGLTLHPDKTRLVESCRRNRHRQVKEQWRVHSRKLRGHFGYFGIIGNSDGIGSLHEGVKHRWRKWRDRRSQRSRMSWERMTRLLEHYPLPRRRIRSRYGPAAILPLGPCLGGARRRSGAVQKSWALPVLFRLHRSEKRC